MKKVLWFSAGIAVGFVLAHQLNQTAQGKKAFGSIEAKVKDFSDAFVEGYHERESELRSALSGSTNSGATK
ncbi:MAG: hypothetical protein JWQ19_3366 [Subtercola sp.]|nr:hypothetical protein [Subtercola sp.]